MVSARLEMCPEWTREEEVGAAVEDEAAEVAEVEGETTVREVRCTMALT
jgi:hypothetical protein